MRAGRWLHREGLCLAYAGHSFTARDHRSALFDYERRTSSEGRRVARKRGRRIPLACRTHVPPACVPESLDICACGEAFSAISELGDQEPMPMWM